MRRSFFRPRAFVAFLALCCCSASSLAAESSFPRTSTVLISGNAPLGGPVSSLDQGAPRVVSNANLKPLATSDAVTEMGIPVTGIAATGAASNGTVAQPPVALGPTPYDLSLIKRVQIGDRRVEQAPLRVGNLDILAPLMQGMPILGATLTRADPTNVPGGATMPSQGQYFQINLPEGAPIVLTIGKSSAWIDNNEQPLRAAPLVIGNEIYLPIFSIAPLLGAAARLDNDGTLVLTPTVQSVELFPVKGTVAVTIKTSAPVPAGAARVVALKGTPGSSPKIYIDFEGYSMGFDAGNSTIERLVAPGKGDVLGARAGMPSKFPDTTRIVLDLKKPLVGIRQAMPDATLFALVIAPQGQAPSPPLPVPPPIDLDDPRASSVTPLLQGYTIVVDAGHGGDDPGAQSRHANEKSHTLDISRRLRTHLQNRGATVLMTRDGDYKLSLQGRADFANSRRADLFISVHVNASVKKEIGGTQTFYYTSISQGLAREVQKELAKATGRLNRGIKQERFYVVRKTWMPSILTESAFISNPTEEALLRDPAYRDRIARGIAQGVTNYVINYGRSGLRG
jgi:N-acetylmuramoyl-L-alanine amidase CwlD